MSEEIFKVQEHVIPCQYIREYPDATCRNQEDILQLCVKQYTPIDQDEAVASDAVTVIAAHANAFPKELYEPLWEELYYRSRRSGFGIRGIWIADVAHQGRSSTINEEKLGNDPSWYDHSRDLLHMINHFRTQMPRPLIGIGHSMGGCQLVHLSLMHPRLLSTLILFDPVIQLMPVAGAPNQKMNIANASTFRRDIWPSRQVAESLFRKSSFYRKWDERVFERWMKFGFRDLPTKLYPASPAKRTCALPVTLATTKHQEVWTFLRPNFGGQDLEGRPVQNQYTHADFDPTIFQGHSFYRPEPARTLHNLPFVRPSVLYVLGGDSDMSIPEFRKQKLESTGSGIGGSGGIKEGRVKEILLEGVGHLIPMEAVARSADACAEWLGQELERWHHEEKAWRRRRIEQSPAHDIMVNDEWIRRMGGLPSRKEADSLTKL